MSGGRGSKPAVRAHLLDARPLTGSTASGIGAVHGTGLGLDERGLILTDLDGREVRRWDWTDVEGWDADGSAPDGEGHVRQLLVVKARPAPFVVLVDARHLGAFLSAFRAAHAEGRQQAAKEAARPRRRTRRLAIATACLVVLGGVAGGAPALLASPAPHHRSGLRGDGLLARALGKGHLRLPAATAAPVPAPASIAKAPLAAHEAFGFLPYWALPDPSSVELTALTTVAYFSVDVNADGTVDESPSNAGWVGYESQALADFITEAHRADERVVLSATCFDQASLDAITHDPAAQATLAADLVALVRAKNLDGVNLDFEGTGPTDRTGLTELVATVSSALHAADSAWQLTVDTYASSASDPGGFYDVAGMAPYVDAFVVMDYDMGGTFGAGPTAGIGASAYTDDQIVTSYSAAAGAAKVILAVPLYGEDFPTVGPTAGDPATGPATPVADDQITPSDTVYWDASTDGPWAVYQAGGQWHQVWFDDPASLAAKDQLVRTAGLRGIGLWALGMAAGTGDQQAALSGVAVVPQPPDGPVTVWRGPLPKWGVPAAPERSGGTTGSAAVGTAPAVGAFGDGGQPAEPAAVPAAIPAAKGVFDGVDVSLVPWPGAVPAGTTAVGSLGAFSSTATSVACLAAGPALPVVQIDGTSAFIVRAVSPSDCAAGTWAFVMPPSQAGSTSSGSTGDGAGARGSSAGEATGSAIPGAGTFDAASPSAGTPATTGSDGEDSGSQTSTAG